VLVYPFRGAYMTHVTRPKGPYKAYFFTFPPQFFQMSSITSAPVVPPSVIRMQRQAARKIKDTATVLNNRVEKVANRPKSTNKDYTAHQTAFTVNKS
jgi:hypothetical protein